MGLSAGGLGRVLRLRIAIVVVLSAAACTPASSTDESAARREARRAASMPNVLIIMTDDQRRGVGVMPKTRRWFRGGTRFTNAFATTPLCCPSRASILSGLYVHNHGVIKNEGDSWKNLDTDKTFPVYLQDAGYRTALFGKYLNRFPIDEPPPGFDRWVMKDTDQRDAYYGGRWSSDGEIRRVRRYSTDFIARRGAQFIRHTDRPWMMLLATAAPHFPFTPEPRYENAPVRRWTGNPATRERDRADKPPYVQESAAERSWSRRARRGQLRTLMSVDDLVGRIAAALAETGQTRDTLAIFMSDNAFTWGDHGLDVKTVPYMDSVRIPLFVRWPGRVPEGEVDERLVANIDVAPTIMDAAGIEPPDPMDGRSLLDDYARDRLLTENLDPMKQAPRWAGLVTHDRHYIETYNKEWMATWHEEYDLVEDPWELENLLWNGFTTTPSPVLSAQLAKDRECRGADCP